MLSALPLLFPCSSKVFVLPIRSYCFRPRSELRTPPKSLALLVPRSVLLRRREKVFLASSHPKFGQRVHTWASTSGRVGVKKSAVRGGHFSDTRVWVRLRQTGVWQGGGYFRRLWHTYQVFGLLPQEAGKKIEGGGSLGHLYFTLAGGLWDVLGGVTFETSAHG